MQNCTNFLFLQSGPERCVTSGRISRRKILGLTLFRTGSWLKSLIIVFPPPHFPSLQHQLFRHRMLVFTSRSLPSPISSFFIGEGRGGAKASVT